MSKVEEWRDIPGMEGSYQVSNLGHIKSLPRNTTHGGIMKPCTSFLGYHQYRLSVKGVKRSYRVHALVMLAFVGPRPEDMEVCHIDGDTGNNRLENLRYDTHKENMRDIKRHGRHNNAHKTHCINGHEFTPENTKVKPTKWGTSRTCLACVRWRNSAEYREMRRKQQESAA